jgi:hypothetical protein
MITKKSTSVANAALLLSAAICCFGAAQAQQPTTPYSKMAAVDEYLMTEAAEVALARSAAPKSISDDATVVVLKRSGYTTAIKGKNGFVCIVERSWMSQWDFPEFWNPKMRGPICFNPAAARSVLPFTYKRTEMILAGLPKDQVIERLKQIVAKKEVPALEPGAMCYMLSHEQYLNDTGVHWHPHLMIYGPRTDSADWGADLVGVPVYLNDQFRGSPEPLGVFMVMVDQWSDGTPAPIHKAAAAN